jgi:hypothetical protein
MESSSELSLPHFPCSAIKRGKEIGFSKHRRAFQQLGDVLEEEKALDPAPRMFLARRFELLIMGNAKKAHNFTYPL